MVEDPLYVPELVPLETVPEVLDVVGIDIVTVLLVSQMYNFLPAIFCCVVGNPILSIKEFKDKPWYLSSPFWRSVKVAEQDGRIRIVESNNIIFFTNQFSTVVRLSSNIIYI